MNQEFESQRFQLYQASRWADQARRDKMNLYGELELRNRLSQENHARDCQEIEELRTICCEESHRARQAKIDELSVHQERNATTTSQLLTQMQELQNKVNSLSDTREFYDPDSGSSSGATFPVNPLLFRVLGARLAAILDCRVIHRVVRVLQETFLNDHLLKNDYPPRSSTIRHPPLRN